MSETTQPETTERINELIRPFQILAEIWPDLSPEEKTEALARLKKGLEAMPDWVVEMIVDGAEAALKKKQVIKRNE